MTGSKMRERVDRLIVGGLLLAVAGAGFLLWLGLGKPGIARARPRPVVTVLGPSRLATLSGILAADALLFEQGPRDAGSDPLEEAVALVEIQCDASRRPGRCRADLVATLIPAGQVHAVDGLVAVAHGRCRRELRSLVAVVGAAEAADDAFGAHGPIPAVQASWGDVEAGLASYVRLDAHGSAVLGRGVAACTPS